MKSGPTKKAPAVSTLPANKKPVAGRTARSARNPASTQARKGSDAGSPCVVASCEEFTLYSDGRVEPSDEVERCQLAATMRISDTPNAESQLQLSTALLHLAEFTASKSRHDPVELCAEIARTLGEHCLKILSVGPEGYDKASEFSGDMGAAVKLAGQQIARWKLSPVDRRSANAPVDRGIVWAIQFEAMSIFRDTGIRPRRSEIQRRLKEDGWGDWKSKEASNRWLTYFEKAGLGSLPE